MELAIFGGGDWPIESPLYQLGREVGKRVAMAGFTVVTGGYQGAMAAASQGAQEAGGRTVGILHTPLELLPPNAFLEEIRVGKDYLDRLAQLLRIPVALALPGESGTCAEIMVSFAMLKRQPGRHLAIWANPWQTRLTPTLPIFREGK